MKPGDFLGRGLVISVDSLVRSQGSGKTSRISAAGGLPPCPATWEGHQQPRVLCHLTHGWHRVTSGMLSETRGSTGLWRWPLAAAGSPYPLDQVLQCSDAYWRTGRGAAGYKAAVDCPVPPGLCCALLCNGQEPSLPTSVASDPSTAFNWTLTDWKL